MVSSRFSDTTPRSTVLTRLYTDLITESLTEFAYDAELAGLKYDCHSSTKGVYVVLRGYNDKMSVLAEKVLERVKNLKVDEERLKDVVERVSLLFSPPFPSSLIALCVFFRTRKLGRTSLWDSRTGLPTFSLRTSCRRGHGEWRSYSRSCRVRLSFRLSMSISSY